MSDIKMRLLELLASEVAKQTPSERRQTITSSGMPSYRIPRSMDIVRGPCCCVYDPCKVHSQYFPTKHINSTDRTMLNGMGISEK